MFFDIHTHYIPGVDDGCGDLAMTEALLCQSVDQGTEAIFATPHSSAFLDHPEKTRGNYRALQNLAGAEYRALTWETAERIFQIHKGR